MTMCLFCHLTMADPMPLAFSLRQFRLTASGDLPLRQSDQLAGSTADDIYSPRLLATRLLALRPLARVMRFALARGKIFYAFDALLLSSRTAAIHGSRSSARPSRPMRWLSAVIKLLTARRSRAVAALLGRSSSVNRSTTPDFAPLL